MFDFWRSVFSRSGGVMPIVLMLSDLVSGYPVIFEDKDGVTAYEPWL